MKNLCKYFMTMAVAVVALSACQKENNAPVKEKGALKISVKANVDDTKSYIDGTAIKWGTGEYMKIGVYDGTATTFGNSTDESANIWNGEKEAMFNFSITPANTADEYTYYGLYPASAAVASSNTNPASYKVSLPAAQKATATSYDPKAYILVAKPEGGKTATEADWEASFRRATALNKVTLENLPEAIKRVTITVPDNIYIAGSRHIDLTTGESGDIYSGGGRTNKVSVKFDQAQESGADVIVWFTSWDASIEVGSKLTIVAYSEAHTYTRELTVVNKPITFTEGKLNTLKVNMATADQGDNTEFAAGTYVVLAKDGSNYYALKAEKEEGKERLLSVAYDGALDSYTGDADIIWNISESGDSFIFENSGKYLGYKGSSNESYWLEAGDSWTETNYLLDITAQETAGLYHVTVNANASRYLSKNSSAAFFAFYGNTGQKADIVFVPATVDTRTDVTLAFEDESVSITTAEIDNFFGQEDVTVTPDEDAIKNHLEWSYEDNDGVIDEFDNGALTLTGTVGTATVTVSFAGDADYKPAQASYTITVTDGGVPTVSYEKVTSAPADWSGDYLLVCENRGEALSSISTTSTKYGIGAAVTISNDAIESNATVDAYKIVIAPATGDGTGYTLQFGANYLSWTSGNSLATIASESDNSRWTISAGATEGNWIIANVSDSARQIWYNTGSPRFACYTGKTEETSGYAAIQLYKLAEAPDTREEAGMSWNAEAATATVNTGNLLSFTAPELNAGHASLVTYESSDETIATINASGEVTVTALDGENNTVKEGSTTIKAIFAGDESYKPQTVSYTLTVADGRDAVPTPTFNPGEGEVTAGTEVTFECTEDNVNFHYTVNGTTPTVDSPIGSSVIINEPTTVKVLAEKIGYKPSEVASASYSVGGVVVNDGSLEHPFTVAEVIAYMDASESNRGPVYIKGIISQVVYEFSASGGNGTFYISDDGETTGSQFEGYRIQFLGNLAWTNGNTQIKVGDEVIIYGGELTIYNTSTYETKTNSGSYIYSLNGNSEAETVPTISTTDITEVSADGVSGANTTVTLSDNDGWDASVVCDGTIVTNASISGSTITYTVAANTGDARSGSITLTLSKSGRTDVSATIHVGQLAGNGSTSQTEEITSGTFSGNTSSISMTTSSGVTITQLKNNGTNVNISYNTVSTLRVYRANQMQFTGKTFTKVEMFYTGSYSGVSWSVVAGGGTVTIDTTNKKVVWENSAGASTVTLQNSEASGTNTQLRTTKFVVTYN